MYEEAWLMPGKIPVTIIDEGIGRNGEYFLTVACDTEYFYQQQANPTDGFDWWCTTYDCSPDELIKKTEGHENDENRN